MRKTLTLIANVAVEMDDYDVDLYLGMLTHFAKKSVEFINGEFYGGFLFEELKDT